MPDFVTIKDRKIGPNEPCFIIAEAGINHNGELSLAKELVDAAVDAKADAVKFQTFRSEELIAVTGKQTIDKELKSAELRLESFREIRNYCNNKHIVFLSTPFDAVCADFLGNIGISAFKLASGEITNLPFLKQVAWKGKPIILSTGMASLGEVYEAVRTIQRTKFAELILLHCVSCYPTAIEDANLRAIPFMSGVFQLPIGFSDHTLGIEAPLAAVALGACVVEKHFTLDKTLPGSDHSMSLDPKELAAMVSGIRNVELSLGIGRKELLSCETDALTATRRSLVASQDISAGTVLQDFMIVAKRPGTGLPPMLLDCLVGRVAKEDIPKNTFFTLDMV